MAIQEGPDSIETRLRLEQLLEAANVDRAAVAAARTELEPILADLRQKQKELGEIATQSLAASTKITDTQAVIAEKSAHIEEAKKHSDDVRVSLDKVLTESRATQTKIGGLEGEAQTAAEVMAALAAELRANKTAIETEVATIKKLVEASSNDAERTKGLAERATAIDERIAQYENKLNQLGQRSQETLDQITELLPGATSAGLAGAFDKRRQTFLKPAETWQKVFVGSLVALVVLASTGLIQVWLQKAPLSLDQELQFLVLRLPVAGALVWLALHASHEATLAKRLEEDYGYKAVIASSFQGFQKQMSDIDKDVEADSPLGTLCKDTLATIASPPGRIYDKKIKPITPSSALTDAAKDMTEVMKLGNA